MAESPEEKEKAGSGERPRRRRAVMVSEVDKRLIAAGLPPSWEEPVSDRDLRDADAGEGGGNVSNDKRLLEDVPPHAQPRI